VEHARPITEVSSVVTDPVVDVAQKVNSIISCADFVNIIHSNFIKHGLLELQFLSLFKEQALFLGVLVSSQAPTTHCHQFLARYDVNNIADARFV